MSELVTIEEKATIDAGMKWWYLWSSVLLLCDFSVLAIQDSLVIKVCCGDEGNCKRFTQAEDLLGVSCCGVLPMNQFTHICCANVVHQRMKDSVYHELCCGNQTLSYDQTCCNEVINNQPNAICCGDKAYSREDRNKLCCNGTLIQAPSVDSVCCGSEAYDGGIKQICCGNKVYDKKQYDSCCRANDGSFQPFRAEVQFCCDIPVQKSASNACCYLRPGSAVIPTPYNTEIECCKFPYIEIGSGEQCKS